MEAELEKKLADMIRSNRMAGLGMLREGAPLVLWLKIFKPFLIKNRPSPSG
jgi:hypothetical protein